MSDPVITNVAGLQVANSTFSASPPGSMSKASNVVISQKGVAQPRNGNVYNAVMPSDLDLTFALTEFQGAVIAQYGLSKADTSQALGFVNSGSISAYSGGPYNPVGDNGVAVDYARMKFVLASMFLHFSCSSGPKCLETYNGTPRMAGVPPAQGGLAGPLSLIDAAGGGPWPNGFLPYDSAVTYRSALKRIASNGVPRIGSPGERVIGVNRALAPIGSMVRAGGTTVTVTFTEAESLLNLIGLQPGDTFVLSPGEANFPAGEYTLNATGTLPVFSLTYTSAGANVSNTVAQECEPSLTGAAAPVAMNVQITLPGDAIAGDVLQLYRSVVTSSSAIAPSDDVYLVAEHTLSSGDISAKGVAFQDSAPQSSLANPLYTNPSDGDGQGLVGGNLSPPKYVDACNFDGATWYCDTEGQQSMRLEILGCGGPAGIQDGDTFIISDGLHTTTMTFKTSPSGTHQTFAVTDGTPSENIAATTQYFVAKMNLLTAVNGISFYSASGSTDLPGKILIRRTDFGPQFNVKVSRPASWTPALDPTTATNSTPDVRPNGLCNSKLQEPEAVPADNFRTVGTANFYARRIFGLRNALLVSKEGDGIWSLNGSGGNYNLQQISIANTIAPDCACVFSDSVWTYTDQGILRVSDTGGAQVVSRPIETILNSLAAQFPTETYAWSFAVPYETERRVMFFVPFSAGNGQGGAPDMQAFCYSLATNAWTGPFYVPNALLVSGVVTAAHRLWLGLFDETFNKGRITEEAKSDSFEDIADGGWTTTLTVDVDDPSIVILASAGAVQKGCGITQTIGGQVYRAKVAAVSSSGKILQLAESSMFVNGACTVWNPYPVEVQFLPEGEPGSRKTLTRLLTLYKPDSFANQFGVTTLETDQIQAELEIPTTAPGYGSTPYGQGPYGNPSPMVVDTNPIDPKWSSAGQFFPGYKLNEVWPKLKLQGIGMQIDKATAPVGRGR